MKYLNYISLILFSVFVLQGCSKDTDQGRSFAETQVTVVKSNVTFTCAGGTGEIVVDTDGKAVTAVSDQEWCTTSVSGQTIKVTVGENINLLSRSAVITITSGEKKNSVPVYQEPLSLTLKSYTAEFPGTGGDISIGYECIGQVTAITSDRPWVEGTVSGNEIVLTASESPDHWGSRFARIKIEAQGSAVVYLDVSQLKTDTPLVVDPDGTPVDDFLNLKNNNGTSSRYKITYFSAASDTYYQSIKTNFPIFEEMRIEAPRSSYKLSVILRNNNGTTYYWNATNGLVPVGSSKTTAAFVFSGNSYSGSNPPYLSDPDYEALRAVFAASTGFTVTPDGDNEFWFRSVANPDHYFRATAASW
jgi:hypothetical protein